MYYEGFEEESHLENGGRIGQGLALSPQLSNQEGGIFHE